MIHKELKKLSRRELVDIIYQMKRNEQQMQEEIAALKEALQERRIRIEKAGSIADAAVSIADVLHSAQVAADLYLQEIAQMKEETQKECERLMAQAKQPAAEPPATEEPQPTAESQTDAENIDSTRDENV